MWRPGSGASRKVISSPSADVFSTGTIASAPAGTGAPVAICTASPLPTTTSGRCPIIERPTCFSSTGDDGEASATSAARTA